MFGLSIQYKKINRLNQHATIFLREAAPYGANIGVVTFSTFASTQHQMIHFNPDSQDVLVKALPSIGSGLTCIGCGLLEGVKVSMYRAVFNKPNIC